MSDADDAYKAAQRLIAEAVASGGDYLSLIGKETRALNTLPPVIAGLTGITTLNLSNTQVTDLAPLKGMTGITELLLGNTQVADLTPLKNMTGITRLDLGETQVTDLTPLKDMTGITRLYLDNTQVADLRPLLHLTELAGFTFQNTPATSLDPKLAELSEIEDDQERTTKTFAYLREVGDDWPPQHKPRRQPSGGIEVAEAKHADLPKPTPSKQAKLRTAFLLNAAPIAHPAALDIAEAFDAILSEGNPDKLNELPEGLEILPQAIITIRNIAVVTDPTSTTNLSKREADLLQLIDQLEQQISEMTEQLSTAIDRTERAETGLKNEGFWRSFKKSAGLTAGAASIPAAGLGLYMILGPDSPAVQAYFELTCSK